MLSFKFKVSCNSKNLHSRTQTFYFLFYKIAECKGELHVCVVALHFKVP